MDDCVAVSCIAVSSHPTFSLPDRSNPTSMLPSMTRRIRAGHLGLIPRTTSPTLLRRYWAFPRLFFYSPLIHNPLSPFLCRLLWPRPPPLILTPWWLRNSFMVKDRLDLSSLCSIERRALISSFFPHTFKGPRPRRSCWGALHWMAQPGRSPGQGVWHQCEKWQALQV